MRITQVEGIILRLPVRTSAVEGTQDDLLVRIETDEGIVGYGETDTSPQVGKAVVDAEMSHGICYGLRDILLGQDPFDIEQLWELMYRKTLYYGRQAVALHVMSAVDMALWDILGQALGKPVHQLLGGSYCTEVRAYASAVMPETVAEMREAVRSYVERGFSAVKLGWGGLGKGLRRDVELAAAAKDEAGGEVDIMIDIGHAYDLKTALQAAREFDQIGIYWMEEPLPPDDLDGYRRLCDSTPLRIAAGENEAGRRAFRRLISYARVDVIQPDISRAGGLTETKKIAYMAYDANRPCVPHAFKSDILLAATLHLLAAIPNSPFLEYSVSESPLRNLLVKDPLLPVDGRVAVPAKPGLGIEVNQDLICKYGVLARSATA
ncbi:MAG: mandelate racemase/muconate lactonizing enzyme family protein [Acidobacteria bacterium]|nr:mandelate racemase/muconate lactonizing enzyme family protein [Acidobacteriota bacterium]